jgi:hypothetical protein
MTRIALATLILLALVPPIGRAEHADIDLRIMTASGGEPAGESYATSDQEPPAGGLKPRPLCKVKANDPLVLQFFLTNTYPHGELKNVTVRYFIVRVDKVRQKQVPDLREGVVTQGRFQLNLKPKGRVGARVRFTLPEPGIYLLRVDTANTQSDHEHFSAMDVKAE